MADYKILQNIDLAQNEIKEVSKIANDRQDGKDKGLRIQTGNDTSLAFNRKIKNTDTGTVTFNSIKGTVKDGTDENKKESVLNLEPSKVVISNTKGTETSTNSTITIGLTTPDSKGKEHIEAVSPSIDIKTGKTGDTDYTHPYISLKEEGSKLELQSETVEIRSKKATESSLKMDGGITGVSHNISLKDSSKKSSEKVSLTLNSDGTNGTISESASKSITETVGTRSVSLTNDGANDGIEIKDFTTKGTPSIIEVNNTGIKASKGLGSSYVDIQSEIIKEQSNEVTIQTPNVILNLKENIDDKTESSASLTSTGTITLTSQNEAKTEYGNNTITTEADTITIKAKGYIENTEATKYYPHIELKSTKDTNPVNSILLEGKTIDISSKDEGSNKGTITLSGSKLNVESATTEITSNDINIKKGNDNVLTLNTSTPKITIPSSTVTDINSKAIGLGDSGSTTTVNGSKFEVYTNETLIENDTTISGTTTIKSSSNSDNTIVVDTGSTLIKGGKADIKSTNVNIGTETTNNIIIGRKATSTETTTPITTLQSSITNITSPTLNVDSSKVDFTKTNQKIIFEGAGGSVTSKVPTYIKDTTFSVEKSNTDSSITEVFKVDTTSDNTSTTINGDTATINPNNVDIGTATTTIINVGRNATGTITTLQSNTTNITSPEINIGTSDSLTSVSIGKDSSTVSLKGKSNFLIEASNTNSKVQANDIKFNTSLSSNDIKIRWDSTLNSLVFEKA